jgi:hypothetical protein
VFVAINRRRFQLLQIFAVFALLTSGVYALLPTHGSLGAVLSYLLLPGVALYTALNGSALFGAGFGHLGNYVVIALGSAAAWAALVATVGYLVARARERHDA